jgi:hypothetical protein
LKQNRRATKVPSLVVAQNLLLHLFALALPAPEVPEDGTQAQSQTARLNMVAPTSQLATQSNCATAPPRAAIWSAVSKCRHVEIHQFVIRTASISGLVDLRWQSERGDASTFRRVQKYNQAPPTQSSTS